MAPKPLLIGTTSDDLPVAPSVSFADPLAYFGAEASAAARSYGALDPRGLALAVGADVAMHEPARFAAHQMTAAGAPAWLYRFGYVPEAMRDESPGAGHASELPFLFRSLAARFGPAATDADRAVSDAFHARIAAFALTGDPNGPGGADWPPFESGFRLMNFRDASPRVEDDPWRTRIELVERAVAL